MMDSNNRTDAPNEWTEEHYIIYNRIFGKNLKSNDELSERQLMELLVTLKMVEMNAMCFVCGEGKLFMLRGTEE